MFGVHDPFLDEFLSVRLLIMRGNRGGGTTAGAADCLAQFCMGAIAWRFRIIHHLGATRKFALGAIEITLDDVSFRTAIDEGDFARALQDHFASDSAHSARVLGEPAVLNLIPSHRST
jgi:hypothetical protein